MRAIGDLLSSAYRRLHRRTRTPLELRRMRLGGEPLCSIGRALEGLLRRQASAQEQERFEGIERLRRRLESSETPLRIRDYGAGAPGLGLSEEEMRRGRPISATLGEICRRNSGGAEAGMLLFRLVRELRPRSCLELGTCLGISTAYQSSALQLNGIGRMVSVEGSPELAGAALENLRQLGLGEVEVIAGRFQDVLDDVLQSQDGVDHVFIDGHHDGRSTVAYAERILPLMGDEGLMVLDDIAWSAGMREAWKQIRSHRRVWASVDLFRMGICAVAPRPGPRRGFHVSVF